VTRGREAIRTNYLVLRSEDRRHQLALYFLDWDCGCRIETIDVLDGDTGQLLNSQQVDSFFIGTYLVWQIQGHVRIKVTRQLGNAVVAGMFIDPLSSLPEWQTINFNPSQLLDPLIAGNSADPDLDGVRNVYEYVGGRDPLFPEAQPFMNYRNVNGSLEVRFTRLKRTTDVVIAAETSSDLKTWTPNQVVTSQVIDHGTTETIVLLTVPATTSSQQFLRLSAQPIP